MQLQINYVDWDDPNVQARKCYEVARKRGTAIIVMEPVKGGSLAGMLPEVQGIFKRANPDASVASWAIRYAALLEGVLTVLSGMSTLEQLDDNLNTMSSFTPLTEGERGLIGEVVAALKQIPTVPCTACRYCVDDCPQRSTFPGCLKATKPFFGMTISRARSTSMVG